MRTKCAVSQSCARDRQGHLPVMLVIAVGFAALPADRSAAQSNQGSIALRGVVPTVCTVALSETSATLDLVRGHTATAIARVEERCNSGSGYVISVTSRNRGRMQADAAAGGVGYTLHYDDATSGADGSLVTERDASAASRRGILSVSMPPDPRLPAGDYEDTVYVSIAAK